MFIDTHTHLYDEQFDKDRLDVVRQAIDNKVSKMLLPNCDSHTIDGMLQLADAFPGNCLPMIGLHPCYVKENFQEELDIMRPYLEKRTFAAIGEIGLDYYWDTAYNEQQQAAFEQQIGWALEYDLPVVVHTRDSIRAGIETIRRRQNGELRGVFHCFSGTREEAEEIIDLGLYLGIGGVLTFKNSDLKQFITSLPIDKLVLETDAPYLAPVPYRGKRNESGYIPVIAAYLADLFQTSTEDIAVITTQNARTLFRV